MIIFDVGKLRGPMYEASYKLRVNYKPECS